MEDIAIILTAVIFLIIGILCIVLPKKVRSFAYTKQEYETETDSNVYVLFLRFFGIVAVISAVFMLIKI